MDIYKFKIATIYRAYCKVNNKSYIGFDSRWPKRIYAHKWATKNPSSNEYHSKFHRAIRKHGLDNFTWEPLYQSKDIVHTKNIMESYFIRKYDSYNLGYNMTFGGDGTIGRKNSSKMEKQILAGTWVLQNIELHKNTVKNQLKNGTHCSQIKKICEYCKILVDCANYSRSHGNNCFLLSGYKRTMPYSKRKLLTCEICSKTIDSSNFKRWGHGSTCLG
jgi:group I intron endonuclease